MKTQMPAGGARRSRTRNSRAVAGAGSGRKPARVGTRPDQAGCQVASSWGQSRRAGQRRRRQAEIEKWRVETDLPTEIPILSPELLALEAQLGPAIEAILSGSSHESTQ